VVHLDTSFLIRALVRGTPEDTLFREWLLTGESLSMSAIAWAEFLCGPVENVDAKLAAELIGERTAFTEDQAATAARLFNESGRRRGSLVDCMIAAAALSDHAPLATANAADFAKLKRSGVSVLEAR